MNERSNILTNGLFRQIDDYDTHKSVRGALYYLMEAHPKGVYPSIEQFGKYLYRIRWPDVGTIVITAHEAGAGFTVRLSGPHLDRVETRQPPSDSANLLNIQSEMRKIVNELWFFGEER